MTSFSTDRAVLRVEQLTLANGMRVIMQPDPCVPLVAAHLAYVAGSGREPPHLCGLAHVCEHVSSLAPPGVSARSYPELIEGVGGLTNGSTSHELISFSALLPAHQLTLGLRVEASRMSRPLAGLTPSGLDAQRGVVLQEYQQRVGNRPYGRGFELVQKLLYPPTHPYHWPPGGLPDCIAAVSTSDVEAYFGGNFKPERAVLVLVGDFSPGAVTAEVARHFGDIPAGDRRANDGQSNPDAQQRGNLPPIEGGRREAEADRVPSARVHLSCRAPGYGEASWYAAALLFRSLAVGRTSPLQQKLVHERGVAREVKAQLVTMRDASTGAFVATAAPGVGRLELEEALVAALDELLDGRFPEAALRRAQKKALTDHYSLIRRPERRAEFIASSAIFCGDPARVAVEDECYRRVTPAEVSEFGEVIRREENRVVLSLVPEGDAG
ncbi:MAG: insulinase family protein [Acidobacteria bacterium]|nr:insulinase family protein [Acidobacteriota bacterium]